MAVELRRLGERTCVLHVHGPRRQLPAAELEHAAMAAMVADFRDFVIDVTDTGLPLGALEVTLAETLATLRPCADYVAVVCSPGQLDDVTECAQLCRADFVTTGLECALTELLARPA